MPHVVLVFHSSSNANCLVAGVPAAARAAREVALAALFSPQAFTNCSIAVPGGWTPTAWCRSELARLASDLTLDMIDIVAIRNDGVVLIPGEALMTAAEISAALSESPVPADERERSDAKQALEVSKRYANDLRAAGNVIIASTRKATDGLISRYINRPVSQAISRFLLRFPGIVPAHATALAGAIAVIMASCLFFGGKDGLIAGALLFQAASIVDGVDGEIARATFRTSASGAMLDSVTDAVTNLAFFSGLTVNLWSQGYEHAATMGTAGIGMLVLGMFFLGRHARINNEPFTFDAVKNQIGMRNSLLRQWLTWLTMRDFIAAIGMILILAGLAPQALSAFAIVTAGWLSVTLFVLFRKSNLGAKTFSAEEVFHHTSVTP